MEARRSRSQAVMLKRGQSIKYLPLAFAGHGAIVVATLLNNPRAVQMLAARLAQLGRRVGAHDHELKTIIQASPR